MGVKEFCFKAFTFRLFQIWQWAHCVTEVRWTGARSTKDASNSTWQILQLWIRNLIHVISVLVILLLSESLLTIYISLLFEYLIQLDCFLPLLLLWFWHRLLVRLVFGLVVSSFFQDSFSLRNWVFDRLYISSWLHQVITQSWVPRWRVISPTTSTIVRSRIPIISPLQSFLEPRQISVFRLDLGVCRLNHLLEHLDFGILLFYLLLHVLKSCLCELSYLYFSLKQLLFWFFTLLSGGS